MSRHMTLRSRDIHKYSNPHSRVSPSEENARDCRLGGLESSVHSAAASSTPAFISSPLGIALFSLIVSMGGGWVKDRLLIENGGTTSAVRIEALSKRVDQLEQSELPAAQFREYQRATDARLDDIRDSLKQIDADLRAKQR